MNIALLFLSGAIVAEVCGTLTLKVAAFGRPRLYAAVVAGYIVSFVLLSAALDRGLGIGIA